MPCHYSPSPKAVCLQSNRNTCNANNIFSQFSWHLTCVIMIFCETLKWSQEATLATVWKFACTIRHAIFSKFSNQMKQSTKESDAHFCAVKWERWLVCWIYFPHCEQSLIKLHIWPTLVLSLDPESYFSLIRTRCFIETIIGHWFHLLWSQKNQFTFLRKFQQKIWGSIASAVRKIYVSLLPQRSIPCCLLHRKNDRLAGHFEFSAASFTVRPGKIISFLLDTFLACLVSS